MSVPNYGPQDQNICKISAVHKTITLFYFGFKFFAVILHPYVLKDDTPMLNVVRPTNVYFGHLFEIILFKYLLLFCAFPCKHVENSSLIFRFLNTCFNNFLNAVCIPGLCLYVAVPLTISLWYLHHDNSVFGQN